MSETTEQHQKTLEQKAWEAVAKSASCEWSLLCRVEDRNCMCRRSANAVLALAGASPLNHQAGTSGERDRALEQMREDFYEAWRHGDDLDQAFASELDELLRFATIRAMKDGNGKQPPPGWKYEYDKPRRTIIMVPAPPSGGQS